ncbi:MAG TPA: hypothetical protein VN878_08695 [Usitatibacter sp.]|nr:hypothetical protein [Usitatibacter sp.]
MKPRTKLLLLAAAFALPITASVVIYNYFRPAPSANYGQLLLPPASATEQPFDRAEGGAFTFGELRERWVLVASDSGACPSVCMAKLVLMRQVRLALGRNASRLARVFVIDDLQAPDPAALAPFEGTVIALTRRGLRLPAGAANDRAHIYLIDPHGNVMMRWPAPPEFKGMLRDLERLLRASQIG